MSSLLSVPTIVRPRQIRGFTRLLSDLRRPFITRKRLKMATADLGQQALATQVRVADIMTTLVVCLEPDMTLDEAQELMLDHGLNVAPVTDRRDHPIGTVTMSDLVRYENRPDDTIDDAAGMLASTSEGFHFPLGEGFHVERSFAATASKVSDVMSTAVIKLPETASVARAAAVLTFEGVSNVVIVDSLGAISGIVSTGDILRWTAHQMGYLLPTDEQEFEHVPTLPYVKDLAALPKTVLVVEDDSTICECIVQLLEEEGYHGMKAQNGLQALHLLDTLPSNPGLIILDLMMPEMNGWDFRQAQLRDDRFSAIPVVVMTAHGNGAQSQQLHSPAAFLHKPVPIDKLLQTVEKHFHTAN